MTPVRKYYLDTRGGAHEDALPADMTQADYDAWYVASFVPEGIGCRIGPAVLDREAVDARIERRYQYRLQRLANRDKSPCPKCGQRRADDSSGD